MGDLVVDTATCMIKSKASQFSGQGLMRQAFPLQRPGRCSSIGSEAVSIALGRLDTHQVYTLGY